MGGGWLARSTFAGNKSLVIYAICSRKFMHLNSANTDWDIKVLLLFPLFACYSWILPISRYAVDTRFIYLSFYYTYSLSFSSARLYYLDLTQPFHQEKVESNLVLLVADPRKRHGGRGKKKEV